MRIKNEADWLLSAMTAIVVIAIASCLWAIN